MSKSKFIRWKFLECPYCGQQALNSLLSLRSGFPIPWTMKDKCRKCGKKISYDPKVLRFIIINSIIVLILIGLLDSFIQNYIQSNNFIYKFIWGLVLVILLCQPFIIFKRKLFIKRDEK